ncbi:chain-length determining protein [Bacterioplanes sanyensis]|uniref:Chain-length determining protein n=1 Tax=Bacterioplanes sanyensis TaxID=1249553 RepID=A0A222FLK6_9GAMM|nr:chain-length determining protein [Bacterioplanes sanyensis]ASP39649.1 chain-length determining protein [Bacterioplanes sanyensis]
MKSLTYRVYLLLDGAWRRRYLIVLPILILPFLGSAVGYITPKKYASHTSMLIQETAKMNPFLKDLAVSAMLKERIGALTTLLHSRHILGLVAKERGLIEDDSSPERHDEVISELSSSLSVEMMGKDLIRIDYRARQADGVKETLEAVSKHFVEQLLAPERSSMQDSSYFLSEHLKQRRQELEAADQALAEFKDKHADELPELQMAQFTRLAQLKQRLAEKQAEMAGAQKSLGGLDQQLSKTNPVVGRIEEHIVVIRGELALLRARYTDNHSLIQGALRNLKRLQQERQKILADTELTVDSDKLWDIASSTVMQDDNGGAQPLLISQLEQLQLARNKVDGLMEETASLKRMIAELEVKTSGFGDHERQLKRLERDQKVKLELYEDLLQRHEMARITGSLGIFEQEKRVKVIDRPFTPTAPSNLPLWMYAIAGVIGGIFLGSGLALVMELTDSTIRRKDQVMTLAGIPVLSRIPPMTQQPEEFGLVFDEDGDIIASSGSHG